MQIRAPRFRLAQSGSEGDKFTLLKTIYLFWGKKKNFGLIVYVYKYVCKYVITNKDY